MTTAMTEVGKAADIFKIDAMSIHPDHVLLTLLDGAPLYLATSLAWPK